MFLGPLIDYLYSGCESSLMLKGAEGSRGRGFKGKTKNKKIIINKYIKEIAFAEKPLLDTDL